MLITVTDLAAQKMKENLTRRGHGVGVRIGVKTTGCSGLAYALEYVDSINPTDTVNQIGDVSVVVSESDAIYLNGLTVDWAREGVNEGFVFVNPNEQGRCGCGKSFTI